MQFDYFGKRKSLTFKFINILEDLK